MTDPRFSRCSSPSSRWSRKQALVRIDPLVALSVVAEATSDCSRTMRSIRAWCHALSPAWRIATAACEWCIAKINPVAAQPSDNRRHRLATARIDHSGPPNRVGTSSPSRPADRKASSACVGIWPLRSTTSAWSAATAATDDSTASDTEACDVAFRNSMQLFLIEKACHSRSCRLWLQVAMDGWPLFSGPDPNHSAAAAPRPYHPTSTDRSQTR